MKQLAAVFLSLLIALFAVTSSHGSTSTPEFHVIKFIIPLCLIVAMSWVVS